MKTLFAFLVFLPFLAPAADVQITVTVPAATAAHLEHMAAARTNTVAKIAAGVLNDCARACATRDAAAIAAKIAKATPEAQAAALKALESK